MKKLFDLFYKSSGICTDTRKIFKKCFFISLKGDNFNGNDYALSAIRKGAAFAIVDENKYADHENIFLVENCLLFLQSLANYHRKKLKIPVVGITGTNGKTTTKELIKAVLSNKYNVLATKGNLNNHIGVPLTLLELTNKHEIAVIEMGASKPGDIKELCDIADPSYGIITNIGNAHMQGFKTSEGVFNTKMELFEHLNNTGGTFIYNSLDETFNRIKERIKSAVLFPFGNKHSIYAEIKNAAPTLSFEWTNNSGEKNTVNSKLVGNYNLPNFLTAIVFGMLFRIEQKEINDTLSNYTPSNNRSQFALTKQNKIIVDCYNANPSSMEAAINNLNDSKEKNKVLILGDMLELGENSPLEHEKIINLAKKYNLKTYTIGRLFKAIESDYITEKFMDIKQSILFFEKNPLKDCMILLKGSRGIALENLIKTL